MPDNYSDGARKAHKGKIFSAAAAVLSVLILAGCAEKDETANLDFDETVDYDYSAEAVTETEITEPALGLSTASEDSVPEKEEEQTQTEPTEHIKTETDSNTDMSSETVSAEKAFGSQTEAVTVISAQTAVPAVSETAQTVSAVPDNTSAKASETTPKSEVVTDCSVPMAQEPSAPADYDSSFFSEDLFIGDSISTGYSLYGFLNEKNVFAKVGLNPSTVLTKKVSTCYGEIGISDMIAYTSPKRVYIMLGSNGIQWLSTDNMLSSTKTLVTLISLACPDATVAIVSVPPVTPEYAATVENMDVMAKINEYNDCLKDYCEENDTLFIDAASVLKNSSGYFEYSYAESDGMHFKASAYKILLSKIQSDVTEFEKAKAEAETEAVTAVSESTAVSVSEDKTEESETSASAAKVTAKKSSKKNESSETAVTTVSDSDKKTEKKESEASAVSAVTGTKATVTAK